MKFGKLHNISGVNFTLPKDHSDNELVLSKLPARDKKPQIFVGCTGWSMKEWVGNVYPKGTKTANFLREYVKQFNTIELNTTHYRIPNEATILKWKSAAPKDFHYCPKIPQTISHSNDLGASNDLTLRFCEAISGLEENLGCSFMQLPPYFAYNRLPILERFLQKWNSHLPLSIEIRHESWFNTPRYFDELSEMLKAYNIALVITDVAGRRDVLHQRLTNGMAVVRFVGNGLHPTDYERADAWIDKLKDWLSKGLHHIYFFPHQPDNILAPEMTQYITNKIATETDLIIRGPKLGEEQDGAQMSLF